MKLDIAYTMLDLHEQTEMTNGSINLALPDSYARAVRDGSEGVWGSAYTKSVLMNLIINAK